MNIINKLLCYQDNIHHYIK